MKLFIATPCYGGMVTRNYLLSMLKLTSRLAREGVAFTVATLDKESLITRARNRLAGQFLANDEHTHLLFIDADINFPPEGILRLLGHGGQVVAGAVPKKGIDWRRLYASRDRVRSPEDMQAAAADFAFTIAVKGETFEHEAFDRRIADGFLKASYVGSAMILIQRTVFETIAGRQLVERYVDDADPGEADTPTRHLHAFFETLIHPATQRYLSEDYAFCHKWRSCAGEIWVDVQTPLGHEGSMLFEGRPAQIAEVFRPPS